MEEIESQQKIIDDKIEELQQQVRYCLNSYDFHHTGNEFEILKELVAKLQEADNVYGAFIAHVRKMRKTLDQGHRMCEEVDKLLDEMELQNGNTIANDNCEEDDDKENRALPKRKCHVTFQGV